MGRQAMAAWVLESAHRYARASVLLDNAGLTYESEVNAALSMELAIKSLLATPVDNERKGTVLQQYSARHHKISDGHNLFKLYECVPEDVAERVGLNALKDLLFRKQDVFKKLRYIYEEQAPGASTPYLMDAACWLIPQLVVYFVEKGGDDKWLLYMRNNTDALHIKKFVTVG
jgi:HEPN domain-containing protein